MLNRLTDCKRFAVGLDLAYCITLPLTIHSVRMHKLRVSVEMETPSKGRMFGWDRCFQAMTSRQNSWGKLSDRSLRRLSKYLENPVEVPSVHLETLDSHSVSQISSLAHKCGPALEANFPDVYGFFLKQIR